VPTYIESVKLIYYGVGSLLVLSHNWYSVNGIYSQFYFNSYICQGDFAHNWYFNTSIMFSHLRQSVSHMY